MNVAGLFVGLATLDLVYRVPEPPTADRKVQAAGQELAAGGPAANAAVTFAALRAPTGAPAGAVVLVTALGRHPLAAVVAGELASRQVTVRDATPARVEPPAVSSAWVVAGSGERSVVSVNADGVAAEPPAQLAGLAAAAPVLLVDGHHLALAVAAGSAARAAGRPVLLDAGSWKPGLGALLPLVDLAACAADFRVPGADSADASATALLDHGVPAVAVTAGPGAIRWWRRAPTPSAGEVPVPAVDAVDTLGAGDAFHGALAWAYATAPRHAPDLPAALAFAAQVAAVRCETAGPRRWLGDPRLAGLAREWLRG